jgi:diguanylate cyclase (GGDEF)-like protein/PAS domain S-box-containing protein
MADFPAKISEDTPESLIARLSLRARLLIATGALLLLSGFVVTAITTELNARGMRARLAHDLDRSLRVSAVSVAERAEHGDYAGIDQLLRRRAAQDDVAVAEWVDASGTRLRATFGVEPVRNRPQWFARLLGLDGTAGERPVELGGKAYGTLRMAMNASEHEERMWQIVRAQMLVSLAAAGALFAAIYGLLSLNLRVVAAIRRGAEHLESRSEAPTITVADRAPPELRAMARAFNRMGASLRSLVNDLLAEKEHAFVVLNSIGDAVITTDSQGIVEYFNPVAERLLGIPRDHALGKPLAAIYQARDERSGDTAAGNLIRMIKADAPSAGFGQYTVASASGEHFVVEQSAAPLRDETGGIRGAVIVLRNVTESRKIEARLAWQASHDALTGLLNRSAFERRLHDLIADARAGRGPHALVYLDLDQFKVVNDTCGHAAGDRLLRNLSNSMGDWAGEGATVARLGGDEFGILLPRHGENEAQSVAEGLIRHVQGTPFTWEGRRFVIGASAGVVVLSDATSDTQEALRAADSGCYAAKDEGRNRVRVYRTTDEDLQRRHGEMQWVSRVHDAFEHDRFFLVAQPIVGLGANATTNVFELLVRLRDPDGSTVPPTLFLPAAERYGIMPSLDRWVVRRAFQMLRASAAGAPQGGLHFHVNLSGASINDDLFIDFLRYQFAASGVPAKSICFEITETAAVSNLQRAASFINQMRSLGCEFALDDFGSGLSSFRYLKHLPVDLLKIDGAFVKNMASDPVDRAMVASINQIGHVLGIRTVAEYVEDAQSLELLRTLGVDFAQGYHLGRPDALETWMTPARATG